MNLKNKTIIVTGSSAGIWEAIALRLAGEWCKLALIARNIDKLEAVAKSCREKWSPEVRVYTCDISQTASLSPLVEQIHWEFWAIDGLINNAGIWQKMMQLDEVSPEKIDPIIATNLSGVIHLTHSVLPILRQQEEAVILNIVSQSGVIAQAGQSIYTATKFGVRGFTDVLKWDLKWSNVRVAGVYQSGTNTSMFASTWETMPLENFTDPHDLADVVVYMLWLPPKIWMHEVRVMY